jgi:hypothetical protein
MRIGGAGAISRADKNGTAYHLYFADGNGKAKPPISYISQAKIATNQDLHRVYTGLLHILDLTPAYRKNLRSRGLSDDEIDRGAYCTLPLQGRSKIASRLVEWFGDYICSRVPGLICKRGNRGDYWTLAGSPGMVIPVRDLDHSICGLVIRSDDAAGPNRYRWFSSKSSQGPGAKPICHVPLHECQSNPGHDIDNTEVIRITEGQLKSDVATALSGVLTIGLPGCSQWRLALPVLQQLSPKAVYLAWDADARVNSVVAKSLDNAARGLREAGFRVRIETWPSRYGKGIDDVLSAGHQPTVETASFASLIVGAVSSKTLPLSSFLANTISSKTLSLASFLNGDHE